MSEPTTSFSASGEEAITRPIDVQPEDVAKKLSLEEFDVFYEVDRTVDEILAGDYRKVAMQFPDELLPDSVSIVRRLKQRIGAGRQLFVLADTSYGSCCVDEVAAQHVSADSMIHYGHACMSQTSRLPVIYVFGRKELDIDDCVSKLIHAVDGLEGREILLKHAVEYSYLAERVLDRFRSYFTPKDIMVSYDPIPLKTTPSQSPARLTSTEETPSFPIIFYIGPESLTLTNVLITNGQSSVLTYDPITQEASLASTRSNKMLMRRYAAIQKARDADVFGILVGTLGVASYLPLITHIRKLLAKSQKKSYTISVGKLNPAKLANFMEIETFVLIACPENSLIEAKDFYRPIVTPFELAIALQSTPNWTGRYVLDFGGLLAEGEQNTEENREEDKDQPHFSLVTGTYRQARRYGASDESQTTLEGEDGALIVRNQDGTVSTVGSAAAYFLQQRTYRGLEQRLGEDAPSVLEQGRSGIARGYQDDRELSKAG